MKLPQEIIEEILKFSLKFSDLWVADVKEYSLVNKRFYNLLAEKRELKKKYSYLKVEIGSFSVFAGMPYRNNSELYKSNLEVFHYAGLYLDPYDYSLIHEVLEDCPKISSLRIPCPKTCLWTLSIISVCARLTRLSFSIKYQATEILAAVATHCPNLVRLSLSFQQPRNDKIKEETDFNLCMQNLSKECPKLCSIKVNHYAIQDTVIFAVATNFNSRLKSLDISGWSSQVVGVTDGAIYCIGRYCPNLQVLRFSYEIKFTSKAIADTIRRLEFILQFEAHVSKYSVPIFRNFIVPSSLTSLYLSKAVCIRQEKDAIIELIGQSLKLTVLSLSEIMCAELITSIQKCTRLQRFSYKNKAKNDIGPEDLLQIASACTQLGSVQVSQNKIVFTCQELVKVAQCLPYLNEMEMKPVEYEFHSYMDFTQKYPKMTVRFYSRKPYRLASLIPRKISRYFFGNA